MLRWFKPKLSTLLFLVPFLIVVLTTSVSLIALGADTSAAAAPPFDPASAFGQLLGAVQGRHWGIVAGVVLSTVTFALRTWIFPNWAWAKTDRGGLVVAYGVSILGTVAASLATGTTSLWTILDSVGSLVFSTGTFNVIRSLKSKS